MISATVTFALLIKTPFALMVTVMFCPLIVVIVCPFDRLEERQRDTKALALMHLEDQPIKLAVLLPTAAKAASVGAKTVNGPVPLSVVCRPASSTAVSRVV